MSTVPLSRLNRGGKLQPVPRKELNAGLLCSDAITPVPAHPIMTVGSPTAAIAPQIQLSVVRNAGTPPIITVLLPDGNGLAVG
jgi:hypothetical protein